MDEHTPENMAKAAADTMAKTGHATEHFLKGGAEAVKESGKASAVAVHDLTKAYQELAAKNVEKLRSAMQALAQVKNPTEFIEVQQKLIKEGAEAALGDSQHIAKMTVAIFTAAFEPLKRQIESASKG